MASNYVTSIINVKNIELYGIYNSSIDKLNPEKFTKLIHIDGMKSLNFIPDIVLIFACFIPSSTENIDLNKLISSNVDLVSETVKLFSTSKIIFCSSVSVYGNNPNTITEDSPLNPDSKYGMSKVCGEYIVKQLDNYSIIRFSSIYGNGMKRNTFLPRAIDQAMQLGEVTIFGKGERLQNYIHISQACHIINTSIEGPPGVFLGVADQSYSNIAIAQIIKENMGKPVEIAFKGMDRSISKRYCPKYTYSVLGVNSEIMESKSKLERFIVDEC